MQKAPKPADAQVGSNIRATRIRRSMSQEKLADQIGVTFQQVQKYEKGTNRVGASRLVQIAAVLDVPVSALFTGATAETDDAPALPQMSREAFGVATDFEAITDPNVRLSIRGLVKSLSRHQVADAA